ncbi:MAG: flagellar basal body protein, partial [Steroidobacteraceae bacterium]
MSFNIALTGLTAANDDLSVTSNNLANVATVGFKSSRTEFSNLFSSSQTGVA